MSWKTASKRRRVLLGLLVLVGLLGSFALVVAVESWRPAGQRATGVRLERVQRSPQWRDGRFVDLLPRNEPEFWTSVVRWLKGAPNTIPEAAPPVVSGLKAQLDVPPATGLRITWFGHSSLLVEIDGERLLLDPVWGERCSPLRFMGPARFHPAPIALNDLPPVSAVLISHDHYDHLDYPTILQLNALGTRFVVPLGVGAHLEYWGVPTSRIEELEWWQSTKVGSVELVATPARHFSGRSLVMADRDQTLWSGWAMLGSTHRAYYSGDTALFPTFREIGDRLGPFDASMIEVGAYNQLWADVHLGPEQALEAHAMVRGGVLFPVHWGT
ncbi:MAG TPA: MBL fold metallo-hydrolase, partial [Polyangiaceae bacterium]|nr:MBL fold metallo-hydrolase [Polyangiaceae bacterium]